MTSFLVVLVFLVIMIAGMAIKLFFFDEAMQAGCGSDPVIVDGEELDCFGCPEEKKKECDLSKE
jgi:hypothetical protein